MEKRRKKFTKFQFLLKYFDEMGYRIATRYGLNGPRIECQWGRDFTHPCGPALRLVQSVADWVPGVFLGVKRTERDVDHPPLSGTEVRGRVELYLYSPSGPSWYILT